MKRTTWRIATDAKTYPADDMSGTGAAISGGRWNEEKVPMVYSSTSRALACLETFVHLNAGGLPLNRYLVEIEIPEDIWNAAEILDPIALFGWDAEPASMTSITFGSTWAKSKRSALLMVPSIIVPDELNVLINPLHSDAGRMTGRKIRKWHYDPRLLK